MYRISKTGWIVSLALATGLSAPSALADTSLGQRIASGLGTGLGHAIADQGNRALVQIRQEVKDAWLRSVQLPARPDTDGSRDGATDEPSRDTAADNSAEEQR